MSRVKRIMQEWLRSREWTRREDVRRAKRLVLGIGTGRCGTTSLTHLLNAQTGCVATHEAYPALEWEGNESLAIQKINALLSRSAEVVADVAWFYLPYLREILKHDADARVICLERPKTEVIASFLRKLPSGVNHWTEQPARRMHRLDRCFPKYEDSLGLAEAIGRYWDEYHNRVTALQKEFPAQIGCWTTSAALNEESVTRTMLQFAGFDRPVLDALGVRLNAA